MKHHFSLPNLICLLAFCMAGLLFQSCEKEPLTRQLDEVHYELRHEDTIKVPYHGYDTLRFQRSDVNGIIDTLTFIGTGKRYYTEERYEMEECEGCYRWYYHDAFEIKFIGDSSRAITLNFVSVFVNARFSISFDKKTFNLSTWYFGHPVFGTSFQTLEINDNIYYYVVSIRESKSNTSDNFENLLYYNVQNGIIKFEFKDKTEFYEFIE